MERWNEGSCSNGIIGFLPSETSRARILDIPSIQLLSNMDCFLAATRVQRIIAADF